MNLDRVIAVRNAKTIYRNGDQCVKVFNENYSKADIFNEALNQARIEETGLHIPRILGVTMIDGKWAILSEFIPGKTLSQLMKEDPDNKAKYLNQFVDIQLEVQSKTCPLLNQLKDKMSRKISEADLDATTRYDLHARLEGMPTHNKVCHGDFWPSNVIISEDGTPYVIDWSHVRLGDRCAEGLLRLFVHGHAIALRAECDLIGIISDFPAAVYEECGYGPNRRQCDLQSVIHGDGVDAVLIVQDGGTPVNGGGCGPWLQPREGDDVIIRRAVNFLGMRFKRIPRFAADDRRVIHFDGIIISAAGEG